MSEDSGWTDPEYDFPGADSSDFTEVPDYLTAAHPLDTAPVIEAAIDWAVDGITETASDIYEWGSEVIDDLVPDFGTSPGSDGGDGGGPPTYEDDGSGGAPSY